ncbi:hypothetical protein ACOMHN_001009 [Nucella lapillus]
MSKLSSGQCQAVKLRNISCGIITFGLRCLATKSDSRKKKVEKKEEKEDDEEEEEDDEDEDEEEEEENQMLEETREVLDDFYRPFNWLLATLMTDDSFLWEH